jgi:hypothetical protein
LTPKAFSGEVGTGSPQKMRPRQKLERVPDSIAERALTERNLLTVSDPRLLLRGPRRFVSAIRRAAEVLRREGWNAMWTRAGSRLRRNRHGAVRSVPPARASRPIELAAGMAGLSAPKISPEELLTGERLQALAEVTVLNDAIADFHTSLPTSIDAVCFPGGPETIDLGNPGGLLGGLAARRLRRLQSARSIFVYTHLLPAFIETVLPHLTKPFVLVTHNSDALVTERFRPLLDDPRLERWFAQSAFIAHPKLECLPIGLANAQWRHGQLAAIAAEMAAARPKTRKVYVNFSPGTHPSRAALLDRFRRLGFATVSAGLSYPQYLAELAEHRYCISPAGNGIDAHRTWEALYLGVIPVVPAEIAAAFPDLPLLGVSDWDAVDLDFLDRSYASVAARSGNTERLRLGWWRDRIASAIAA